MLELTGIILAQIRGQRRWGEGGGVTMNLIPWTLPAHVSKRKVYMK